ncbi:MAG: response regulator [Gemmatimonas sp.]
MPASGQRGQITSRATAAGQSSIPNAIDDVLHSLRILIVEDHDDLADALRTNLRSEGYHASVASDGRQALAMVRADPPDIVVLDLGIPGIDGLGLLSRLRAEGHWCPVLILSARDADSDKVEGFRLGADDYVTKPFRTVELMARGGRDGAARRPGAGRGVGPGRAGCAGPCPGRFAAQPTADHGRLRTDRATGGSRAPDSRGALESGDR